MLRQLLSNDCTTRSTALDLLAVDALITYAFELATGEPSRLLERATKAMHRIASIPAVPDGPA
jgi:hypothetical protein